MLLRKVKIKIKQNNMKIVMKTLGESSDGWLVGFMASQLL